MGKVCVAFRFQEPRRQCNYASLITKTDSKNVVNIAAIHHKTCYDNSKFYVHYKAP